MAISLDLHDYDNAEQMVYTIADAYFAFLEQHGDAAAEQLSDEQHTLMAYVYLDSMVQEGGFVALIASGYGEYVLLNPLVDSLRRWKIKPTPKILDKAKQLYQQVGAQIEAVAESGESVENLRQKFNQFEDLDGDYYEVAEGDMNAVAQYIAENKKKFCLSE
ncbi:MAG: DUF4375 domain-containing protein [Neisseria sp.]|nr:DUF4375 domain-containing protein [Neisseria sp.]